MLLNVKNLTKRFGGLTAVNNVSLQIEDNSDIVGLIGPNGAGKSTFFNLIAGVHPATEGEIYFEGQLLNKLSPNKICNLGISRTFQNIRLFNKLTVLENVMVALLSQAKTNWLSDMFKLKPQREQSKAEAYQLLEFVGLREKATFTSSNLSYGDQRRLEIARALASKPKLLFLDEPAAGMNIAESNELVTLIRRIHEQGTTVVLIEHDMKLVMGICDRIFVLNRGEKLAEGTPDEIRHNEEVIHAYLGQEVE